MKEDIKKNAYKCFINPNQAKATMDLLKKCHNLWKGTKFLKNTFQTLLFYFITLLILVMFFSFSLFVKGQGTILPVSVLILFSFNFTCSVYFASNIPEEMEEIILCLKNMYEEVTFCHYDVVLPFQKHLELIMNKQPIVLSMGGFAELRRGFIFVTFGSLFSYGIIILSND